MPNIAIDEPAPFQLHVPTKIEDALKIASEHSANFSYLAGGCDLLDMMKRQWNTSAHVIDLKHIDGLGGIGHEDGYVTIGALTKLDEIEDGNFGKGLRALKDAASRIATPQIRNMGTAGGNILQDSRCPYYRGPFFCYRHGGMVCDAHHGINREHAIFGAARCYTVTPSDLAPVVVALGSTIVIRGVNGEIHAPAEDIFVPPGENITTLHRIQNGPIVTAIRVPLRKGQQSVFIKDTVRNAWDFARASVAVVLELRGRRARNVRIVLGGVAAVPWRARSAERVLEGGALNSKTIEKAAVAAVDGAAPLQYNAYKVGLTRKVVRHALTEIAT